MRVKEMTYDDYGITEEEQNELKNLCRKCNDEQIYLALCHSAWLSNKEIADDLVYSLINGLSYEKMCIIKHIPIGRNSFYAYRQRTIATFKIMIG